MASKNWIAGAIKHPGSLHRALGVPSSKNIPQGAIAKAAASRNSNLARKAKEPALDVVCHFHPLPRHLRHLRTNTQLPFESNFIPHPAP